MATPPAAAIPTRPGVYLYWIPLGAGPALVRCSGRTFEALSALLRRRPRRDRYHSALVAVTNDAPFMIEMTPVIDSRGRQDRGVVAEGTVGTERAGRLDKADLSLAERAAVRMVHAPYGDVRDWSEIRSWAKTIVAELTDASGSTPPRQ